MAFIKINVYISFLIILSIYEINTFKCITDRLSINPGILNAKRKHGGRMLEDEEEKNYTQIKIGLDYTQFDNQSKSLNLDNDINFKIKKLINETIEELEKILMVVHDEINLTEINYIESTIKSRCELDKISDSYGDFLLKYDVIIFPTLNQSLNDLGDDILAAGKFCLITTEYKVIGGNLNINPNITFNKTNSDIFFKYSLFHQLTHIFIFHPVLLKNRGIMGDGNTVISDTVLEKAKEHYNCKNIEGMHLEDLGGKGVSGYHWDPRYMLGDYMISMNYNYIDFVISDITLALFEDSGFYKVNYYTGGLFKFGKNKRCEFLKNECYNVSFLFEDEFCMTLGEPVCSQSRAVKGKCAIYNYTNFKIIDKKFQYFEDPNLGGLERIDYCQVPDIYIHLDNESYFSQNCKFGNTSDHGNILGEIYSDNSFCFISNLLHKNSKENPKSEAVCYKIECNKTSNHFKVYIGDEIVDCYDSKNMTLINNYKGYFICPNYEELCHFNNNDSLICNEIFDCIDKEIEADNNTYDFYKDKDNFSQYIQFNFIILFIFFLLI